MRDHGVAYRASRQQRGRMAVVAADSCRRSSRRAAACGTSQKSRSSPHEADRRADRAVGHHTLRVGSGEEEALFSGDAVQHSLQPSGQDIYFLSGTDRRQAFASRTASPRTGP